MPIWAGAGSRRERGRVAELRARAAVMIVLR